MDQNSQQPKILNRKTLKVEGAKPTISKKESEMKEADRKKKIEKLISKFTKLNEQEMRAVFVEATGNDCFIRFLKTIDNLYGSVEKSTELEYPYLKLHKQFMIDKKLKTQKAIEFKRIYYVQFRIIFDQRKAKGDDPDQIYRDLAQFLSKITADEAKDKKKRIYFSGRELKDLMETIEDLEKAA